MFLSRLPRPRASRWFRRIRQRRLSSTTTVQSDRETIFEGLTMDEPTISPRWLYDTRGSDLFEEITKTEEYYLTRKEIELLENHADAIAPFRDEADNPDPSLRRIVVELGAGSGRKTTLLLNAIKKISGEEPVTYTPVDVSESALLENAKKYNLSEHGFVVKPKVAMYQDCLPELGMLPGRKTFLFLGSSLGNYSNQETVQLLSLVRSSMGLRDRFLVGVDTPHGSHKSVGVIEAAYNDKEGITAEFTLNSLSHVNRIAGLDFDTDKFRHVATYDEDQKAILTYVESLEDQIVKTDDGKSVLKLQKEDRIFMEQSRKFSSEMMRELGAQSGLMATRTWTTDDGCHLIVEFCRDSLSELGQVSDWIFDGLAKHTLGGKGLLEQPISLRHPFLFYKGHIPSFLHAKTVEDRPIPGFDEARARELSVIFERGMDPEVGTGEVSHRHSKVPPQWPSEEETQAYETAVRQAAKDLIRNETGYDRRALIGIEHECMHQETLLYMAANAPQLSQTAPKRPPPPHPRPMRSPLTKRGGVLKGGVVEVKGAQGVVLGATERVVAETGFAWDNEIPSMTADVATFGASKLPVTNEEFLKFVEDGGYSDPKLWGKNWGMVEGSKTTYPVNWIPDAKGGYSVRTLLDGPQEMSVALNWPAVVTLAEAQAYCNWLGGGARVMSEAEYHLIFHHEQQHAETDVDAFLRAAHTGNNNWEYSGVVPVGSMGDATETLGISDLAGNGWEWTSTPFLPFPGFEAMPEYDEYSKDFFGDKHFVMKGGSPFTDRQLTRLSLRNWFQAQYPYVWAKFRVCY